MHEDSLHNKWQLEYISRPSLIPTRPGNEAKVDHAPVYLCALGGS